MARKRGQPEPSKTTDKTVPTDPRYGSPQSKSAAGKKDCSTPNKGNAGSWGARGNLSNSGDSALFDCGVLKRDAAPADAKTRESAESQQLVTKT